ncbi:uncharacterized protein AC631_00236 [Debaryomyces fabryi]|uniref:Transcription factor Iwr1 domain-containing protein n=1 Tax=Debaryomyces fabryi TaxID=58627 RepID=A0A0V1Q629_9ASCO|nr:uncharacterized protein AC631_00236 [Debaryomyces fabryi]KSA03966.1 hypothetical protein AC631_00236 [Debaryomyces fabryi]CUM53842.1 unnamed protein product [Debaryomyces fabryi]
MEHEPPQILRIKRKRGQDPLQALILEDNNAAKRSKPSSPASSTIIDKNKNFYFTLTRTDEFGAINEEAVIESILSEAPSVGEAGSSILDKEAGKKVENSSGGRKRKFIIPKKQTEEDAYIPNELADMVSSLLTSKDNMNSSQRKRRNRKGISASNLEESPVIPDIETENKLNVVDIEEKSDYVYDVYQLSSTEPMTTANHPQSQIGYIRFFDEENDLYQSDEENEKTNNLFSDDEDSNAESFYQNDYPSDEDAGAYSDTYTEEEIEVIQLQDGQDGQEIEGYEYINSEAKSEEGFEDLYDDFYDGDNNINFLADDQYQNIDNDQEFERNHFFENEEEDDLAIHRDIIFGKLKKMIDERE